ncbi:carbohydrate binding domain-containing protein, partial [Streptomyces sp. NPDC127574]
MPRRRWAGTLAAAVTASVLSLTGLAGQAQAADVNNAKNGGYESGLSNWTCSAGSGATVSSPVHGGSAALKATPAGQDNAQCTQAVAVKPNSTYTLSAWVQGGYSYLGATGTGTTDVSTWTPDSSSWTQLKTTFTTGASTTSVTVYTHGWYGQAAYFADDLSVLGPDGGGGGDPAPTVPAAPGGLGVSSTTSSSVSLAWNTVSGATGYNVYRSGSKVQSVTGTSATVSGLAASTAYSFQVTATNAAGESVKSSAVTGTTTASSGGGGGGSVPAHAVTGYWQNFNNGATVQK